jgi:hypothetical protein
MHSLINGDNQMCDGLGNVQETQQECFYIDTDPLFWQDDHPMDEATTVDDDNGNEGDAAMDQADSDTNTEKSQKTGGYTTKEDR